jgi:hypothetical protein
MEHEMRRREQVGGIPVVQNRHHGTQDNETKAAGERRKGNESRESKCG